MGKKITKEITLDAIESIVDDTVKLENFGPFESLFYAKIDGYNPDLNNNEYIDLVKERIQMRIDFINENNDKNGLNTLPAEAVESLENLHHS